MKYTLFLQVALLCSGSAMSQTLHRATFSSGGNNDTRVTATIGEPIAVYAPNPAGSLSIGAQPGDDGIVSVQNTNKLEGVTLLPNPTEGLLGVVIRSNSSLPFTCQVYSVKGDLLFTQTLTPGQNQVDLCDLPANTYLLLVQNNSQSTTFKVVKL